MLVGVLLDKMMANKKIISAFLIAPLVPAIIFSILATFTIPEKIQGETLENLFLSFCIWLSFAIPFSYIAAIIIGIPTYLMFGYKNINGMLAFCLASAIIGACIGWFVHVLFGANEMMEYLFGSFLGATLGLTSGYSFYKLQK